MKKKRTPKKPRIFKCGDDDLFILFDTGEAEHVAGLIRDLADPATQKDRDAMAEALRRLLIAPLESLRLRYLEAGHSIDRDDPLDRLSECAEITAQIISNRQAMDKTETAELADDLFQRWMMFIAWGAAHRMYADMPNELDAGMKRTATIREKRACASANAPDLHRQIIEHYAALQAQGMRGLRKIVARDFHVAGSTVKNIWNARDRTKYPGK